MKKIKLLSILMLVVMALPFMISCSKDDDESNNGGSGGGSNITVVVNDDGTTSNGSVFSAIDDKNFYLDYIKYSVKEDYLVVSGYDKAGFNGVAKIASRITYKGYSYEVLKIYYSAFDGCSVLTSVTIPNSVTSILSRAFQNCKKLTSVTISNSVTTIGESAFHNCSGLTSISIPNSVTYIESYAFQNCSGLNSVTIPNSVTGIGQRAFDGTRLISLTIGNSVKGIGACAFLGCASLTEIHCLSPTPPQCNPYNNTFDDETFDATLYVPKGSLDAYRNKSPWNDFEHIVEE